MRALRKYGVDSQFLYKRPKTVFWTVHVAMTIALPGLVAAAMTLQHMDLIAMQFAEGSVTQISGMAPRVNPPRWRRR